MELRRSRTSTRSDFDTVATAGTYRVVVTGPAPATSPAFRIGTGIDVYGGRCGTALAFYQVQRDGAELRPVGAPHRAGAPERRRTR